MPYPYGSLESFRDIPAYDDLTSPDVAAAVAAGAHVIVPSCATEAHGAHLPLGTDTIQGLDMSRRAVHRLQQEGIPVLLGPAIPFGPKAILTESPREFPGTINVSHDTLKHLARDGVVTLGVFTCQGGRTGPERVAHFQRLGGLALPRPGP